MNQQRVEVLEQFVKDEPNNPFNRYALAMEYYEVAPGKSLSILKDLLSEHKEYLPAYFKTAHLLWDSEEWEEADLIFRGGIELADKLGDSKTLHELKSAYQNFLFDKD